MSMDDEPPSENVIGCTFAALCLMILVTALTIYFRLAFGGHR